MSPPFGFLFSLIDPPLCLIADTLALPYTVSASLLHREEAQDDP